MAAVITEGPDKARETAEGLDWPSMYAADLAVVLAEVYQQLVVIGNHDFAFDEGVKRALEAVAEELT